MSLNLGILASSRGTAAPPSGALVGDASYSLAKINNSYSGQCIRVRRSSDNVEQDIGFLSNNLDTASLATFLGASNGFIRTWYDQSGNTKNAIQTTTANQPQITLAGDIVYDGTNDNLILGANVFVSNITFNASGTWSFWINPSRTSHVILGISDNNATGLGYIIRGNIAFTNIQNSSNSNQFTDPSITLNTWQNIVLTFTLATRLVKIYKNGVSLTTNNSSIGSGSKFTDIAQTLYLGFNSYKASESFNYFQGKINDCQIYKSVLTDAQVLTNYNATKEKYGL